MLRKIRTILAAVFFVLITLLFLDFTGTLHHWLNWMAQILLFDYLSVGCLSGCFSQIPKKKEQVQLF